MRRGRRLGIGSGGWSIRFGPLLENAQAFIESLDGRAESSLLRAHGLEFSGNVMPLF